jgi:hypothetical protein
MTGIIIFIGVLVIGLAGLIFLKVKWSRADKKEVRRMMGRK